MVVYAALEFAVKSKQQKDVGLFVFSREFFET